MRGDGSEGSKERELEGDFEGDVEEHNEGGGGVGAKR